MENKPTEQFLDILRLTLASGVFQAIAALAILVLVILFAAFIRFKDEAKNTTQNNLYPNVNANIRPVNMPPSPAVTASAPLPTNTPSNGNTYAYSNSSNTMSNTAVSPANTARNTQYNWIINVAESELYIDPSEESESVETLFRGDEIKMNYRKSDSSKWYNVTTTKGKTGWIDGNFIERAP